MNDRNDTVVGRMVESMVQKRPELYSTIIDSWQDLLDPFRDDITRSSMARAEYWQAAREFIELWAELEQFVLGRIPAKSGGEPVPAYKRSTAAVFRLLQDTSPQQLALIDHLQAVRNGLMHSGHALETQELHTASNLIRQLLSELKNELRAA